MKTITRKLTEDQIFEMEYRAEQARERAQKKAKTGKKNGFKVEVRKPVEIVYTPETPVVLPNKTFEEVQDPWAMPCVHIVDSRQEEKVQEFWQNKFQLALPPAPEAPAPVSAKGKRAPKTTRVLPKHEVFVPPTVDELDPTEELTKEVTKRARRENARVRIQEKSEGEYCDSYGIYATPGVEVKKANRKVRDTLAAQKRKTTKPVDAQKGDYRKLQSSNSLLFKTLSKQDQAYLREAGYKNVGWAGVLKSAHLIEQFKLDGEAYLSI